MSEPPPPQTPLATVANPVHGLRWAWVAVAFFAITLLIGFLAIVGALLYLSFKPFVPKARTSNSERITAKPLGNGWAYYHLKSMELSIALPSPPSPYTYDRGYFKNNRIVTEYAAYKTAGRAPFTIHGYWERYRPLSMRTRLDQLANRILSNVGRVRNVVTGEMKVGGLPGISYRCEYIGSKYKMQDVFECGIAFRDKTVYYFECVYLKKYEMAGHRVFDYALHSVRFDP